MSGERAKFRRAKGGVKAQVLLDHDDYLPRYVLITEARRSDVKMADAFPLNPGSIVVMDRGYNDYALFGQWTDQKIYFLTRLKDHAAYEVLAEGPVPANRNILSDQLIQFSGEKAQKDCPCLLRRGAVWDAPNEREIVLLTNLQEFGSTTIAAIYKDRWEIELFFENSTWGTPLDVMIFRGSIALNRPLVGSLDACVRPRIAPRPLCAESRAHSNMPATLATVSTESTAIQWLV